MKADPSGIWGLTDLMLETAVGAELSEYYEGLLLEKAADSLSEFPNQTP